MELPRPSPSSSRALPEPSARPTSLVRKVLVAGRPGAGKGTQSARLARRLAVRHLSTGDLLRHEIAVGSALGRAVERLVNTGRLVPTGLVIAIVEANIDDDGYVLDGYPRTVAQAEGLCGHATLRPDLAIHLDVSRSTVVERLRARARHDDGAAAIRARLEAYEQEMVPSLVVLREAGVLCRIDGDRAPDEVAREIWSAVSGREDREYMAVG
jgi:adenylate kinase